MSFSKSLVEKLKNRNTIVALTALGVGGLVLIIALSLTTNRQSGLNVLASAGQATDLTILGANNDIQVHPNLLQDRSSSGIRENPLVRVSRQGRLRGTTLSSRQGRSYFAFYNIPYAQPPVGNLRFQPPQSPKRWRGTRDARKPGSQCIQLERYNPELVVRGKEDCLILNVYTPKLPQDGSENPNLPVIFYVHGGGQYGNGTRYGAKYFMDEDVVLVTIEFRGGIFGHFTTGTPEFPGNIGSKDQVAALKWVNKNIERFGGDPDKVTAMGHSTGGFDVQALLISRMTKGLFRSAIFQSGSALRRVSGPETPAKQAKELAARVGCEEYIQAPSDLADCLRKIDADTLVISMGKYSDIGYVKEPIPENGETSNTFFTDYPWNLIQQGESHSIPILCGSTTMEGLGQLTEYLLTENGTNYLNDNWNEFLPEYLGIPDDSNHSVAKAYREFYFGDRRIDNETRVELKQFASDPYTHPMRLSALLHTNTTGQPAYLYWLTKEPALSYAEDYKKVFPPPYGVSHADELQYFFLYNGYPEIPVDSPWFDFSNNLVKIWTSFVHTGKPVSPSAEWKPIDPADNGMKWFELGDSFGEVEPVTDRMLFVDNYINQLYVS